MLHDQVQISRQFKSTNHDDVVCVCNRVVLKLSSKLCGIASGSQITSILQKSTIPEIKWSKFSFIPFKDVEEISHFRVISKWTPGSDANTENR